MNQLKVVHSWQHKPKYYHQNEPFNFVLLLDIRRQHNKRSCCGVEERKKEFRRPTMTRRLQSRSRVYWRRVYIVKLKCVINGAHKFIHEEWELTESEIERDLFILRQFSHFCFTLLPFFKSKSHYKLINCSLILFIILLTFYNRHRQRNSMRKKERKMSIVWQGA